MSLGYLLFNNRYCFIIDVRVLVVLPILFICLLVYISYRMSFFRLDELPLWAAPALLIVKLFFGFALWAVYTFYYTNRADSDIYKFYDDAHYIHQAAHENKHAFLSMMLHSGDSSAEVYTSQMKNWVRNFNEAVPFNENRFMIKLNALMMFVSGENMHVHTILFCFISFIGCILLLKVFQFFLPTGKKKWAPVAVIFPSFLFWTSGGLKESIIILALGLLLYGFFNVGQRRLWSLLCFISGVLLLLMIKYFLLLCLLPALAGYYLYASHSTAKQTLLKYTGVLMLSLIILLIVAPIDSRLDFARIIAGKQKDATNEALYLNAGSYSEVPVVKPNFASVVIHLPVGLWDSMVKPYPWECTNPMMLLSAGENIVFILLLILALVYRDKAQRYDYNIILFVVAAAGLYFSAIGIMTPVLGNLVRYKVILMPLLLFLLIYISDIGRLPLIGRK